MSFLCPGTDSKQNWMPSSPKTKNAKGKLVKDSTFRGKILELARLLGPSNKFALVDEVPSLPTVALDLDGTLIHTLVDPMEIAAAQQSGLTTIRLPGNMGLVVQRPGLEQLFSSTRGYNVVLYSAGGSSYVNVVVEHLARSNTKFQCKFCRILCRSDLTRYSHFAEVPRNTPLNNEGVNYVKDLRKARRDGNSQKVVIVDDNPLAFEVQPHMEDDNFKRRHDFSLNAVPVPDFRATSPHALFDAAFVQVAKVLQDISGAKDILAALKNHSDLAELRSEFREIPSEGQIIHDKTLPPHVPAGGGYKNRFQMEPLEEFQLEAATRTGSRWRRLQEQVPVARVLQVISGAKDILAALKNHSDLEEIRSEFREIPSEGQIIHDKTPPPHEPAGGGYKNRLQMEPFEEFEV